jgi:WD40 repeat protein
MRHTAAIWGAAYCPDGKRVMTVSYSNVVQLWDPRIGQPLGAPMKHDMQVRSAFFSHDCQKVLTASLDGSVRLWATQTSLSLLDSMENHEQVWFAR